MINKKLQQWLVAFILIIAGILIIGLTTDWKSDDYNYCHSKDWPAALTEREISCLNKYSDKL